MSGYEYQADPAGSRSMELDLITINDIDADGLWVTVFDEEDMECELIIKGFTPEVLNRFLEKWGF